MDDFVAQRAEQALQYLQARIPSELLSPVVGIICGSGLGTLAASVLPEPIAEIPYTNIPYFPQSTGT